LDSIPKILPFYGIEIQKNSKMNRNGKSEERLESIRYREGGIKIQKVAAILKIPQIGGNVPLVVEGASEDKLLQLVMPIFQ
jgi:sortase (surface protein transpeptidase)